MKEKVVKRLKKVEIAKVRGPSACRDREKPKEDYRPRPKLFFESPIPAQARTWERLRNYNRKLPMASRLQRRQTLLKLDIRRSMKLRDKARGERLTP